MKFRNQVEATYDEDSRCVVLSVYARDSTLAFRIGVSKTGARRLAAEMLAAASAESA